jgi:urea transport system substrate-binding protein
MPVPPDTRPLNRGAVTRRESLRSGVAATLAAARVLAPSLFVGCSLGIPPRAPTVRIGLLHSQTGPLAIGSTSLRDVEVDAVERFNAAGGILGFSIDPRAPDPRSRTDLFPKRAATLLDDGAVALFGCWSSASRKAVLPIVEERDSLLFYPVQYEGNESSRNVIYGGQVPNQQVLPALDWLRSGPGGERKKFFLLGSDYVYPRTTNFIVRKWLAGTGVEIVGEEYVSLDRKDFAPVVARIRERGADCILNTVNGSGNIALFAALAEAGIDPEKVPLVSTSVSEDDLRSMPAAHLAGHWVLSSYFQTVDTPANAAWMAGFRSEFGEDRVFGDSMEAAWCLINLWKAAVEQAGSFATEAVRQVFATGIGFDGPGGRMTIDPATQHATKHFRMGRVRPDRLCDVVVSSDGPLASDPYPQVAFPGWKCDWTKGGLEPGPEVSIDG